ncbi:hypothetical protein [Nostoc piscinale]|uniref:hypothetical protein n=1 Tax=Nostoc piscinale TaxID=224012 RepID=UPI00130ECCE1|nr:hypothetical protein [Nostoc piscinale]
MEEYWKYLTPLLLIINAQLFDITGLTANQTMSALERMIHQTVSKPNPKHPAGCK